MNEELKPCPGCGKTDQVEWFCFCANCMTGGNGENCKPTDNDGVVCHDCEISMNYKQWQSRPIEDALRAEIKNIIEYYDPRFRSLWEKNEKLRVENIKLRAGLKNGQ